jgi:hypothetical protein
MDSTEEILSYLGLGDAPLPQRGCDTSQSDAEQLLAVKDSFELWVSRTEAAEWIELRGPAPTLRATRPKAILLLRLQPAIEGWANGFSPEPPSSDVALRVVRRSDERRLEIRYRSWKAIRLCRAQAAAILLFHEEIRRFISTRRR